MGRDTLSQAFAKVLRREREARGMSQERLAHIAGIHRTYVGLIERHQRQPTIEVGHALARALGLSLSDMVKDAERRSLR